MTQRRMIRVGRYNHPVVDTTFSNQSQYAAGVCSVASWLSQSDFSKVVGKWSPCRLQNPYAKPIYNS